ncbi:MAG: apolipoprotein N-acyltransferase [Proteobacteria bacterium]|nr:apolipoprotein N-acyltransferase [Pseudomonadota bacterium]
MQKILTNFMPALLSGTLLFFSAPGLFGNGLLAWFCLVPLFYLINKEKPGQAALSGLACGILYYTGMLYWIVIVLGRYGHLPWWISVPALLMLACYMALYLAAFAALTSWVRRIIPVLWVAPIIWVSLDLIRNRLFSGFPWQDLAYSQYDYPSLIQFADLGGHYGVTFLIVLTNGFIYFVITDLWHRKKFTKDLLKPDYLLVILLIISVFSYNQFRTRQISKEITEAENISVAVIQGNISQDEKWQARFRQETINRYLSLSATAITEKRTDLLIWPETAVPLYPMEAPVLQKIIHGITELNDVSILTGAPHRIPPRSMEANYYNSAFLFSPDGTISGRYDKQHLVPFGEYVPLKNILRFLGPLVETIGDFSLGEFTTTLSCKNARLGVLICFESIFPELARRQVAAGANLLVNITNDAWFGRSSAPWQHLSMAVLRAIETRRSLARSANTGISGFIDPLGRINKSSPLFEQYIVADDLPLLNNKTVFTDYGGHNFAVFCLLSITILMITFYFHSKKK